MTTSTETQHKKTAPGKPVQARAALFNLVAFAPNRESLQSIKEIVQAIGFRFPCRLILIDLENGHNDLKIETVPCPSEERQKTYDQLLIHASKDLLEKVPFVVMPHLIPDVPVYLLWGQDPTLDTQVLPFFRAFASRVIFDASSTEDWSKFAERVINSLAEGHDNMMDLSWALISGWRDVLSRLFNDQQTVEELRNSKKILIVCRRRLDYAAGVYLLSWLCARLGWQQAQHVMSEGILECSYHHGQGKVVASIAQLESSDKGEGGIASIEIITASDIIYQMSHRSPSRIVVTHISRPEYCELPITLPFACLNRSYSLMRELLHQQPGEHYQHMLQKLVQFSKKA